MRQLNKANSNNARRGKRQGKLIGLGVFLLLALVFIGFAWYGAYTFFSTYRLRSPIVIQSPVVKREPIKKHAPSPRQPSPVKRKVSRGIVPKVEAAEIERFPKYLTDAGAEAREWTLNYVSKYYSGNELVAFDNLMKKEAGYRYDAVNEIGACGIPQALPCEKMNCPLTRDGLECQVQWVVGYLNGRYHGSPLEAWNFHLRENYY